MKILVAALLAALLPITASAATTMTGAPPQRHLVYAFTYGVSTDTQMHTSGIAENGSGGAASGMVDNTGGSSDKGTIVVDVVREQPDSGLVIVVSEQGQATRKAPPATCVVFSDTTTICDPNQKVTAEELTLLRFLGAHFVDPSNLDAKGHWHVERDGPSSTVADYTISKNNNGAMTIDEVRVVKESSSRPQVTNINSTIGYDFTKSVPTSVTEYAILRSEQGEQYSTIKSETQLSLQTDSMATAKN
ncbi:MAG TPA: hypothetical protein VKB39_08330 [Candidatus Baltobacteraceae bacterium]|nr:hypothetical protein [Candidatus Baltobacteraceae bacterium]